MPLPDAIEHDSAASPRWLSIVGIGEDGVDGLSATARGLIGAAEIVFGGRRHLSLAAPLIRGAARPWPSPFDGAADEVLLHRGRQICVLASGDPFHYGVGTVLARRIDAREMIVAAGAVGVQSGGGTARLVAAADGAPFGAWPHPRSRTPAPATRRAHSGTDLRRRWAGGIGAAARGIRLRRLACDGAGSARRAARADSRDDRWRLSTSVMVDPLNTVAIEVAAAPDARIIARAPGLADELFEHDGQITKREVRALTLSALAPRRGELLWDIGAGAGSVAIEWMLADPTMRAIAIERRADRAARIRRNAAAFGVPGLEIVEDAAPSALAGLAPPDAIFIGGGASYPGVLDAAIAALRAGGRLVVNAVTLETEALLLARHAALGGELIRIAIARAGAVGEKTGWRAAMPVTQWVWIKP